MVFNCDLPCILAVLTKNVAGMTKLSCQKFFPYILTHEGN